MQEVAEASLQADSIYDDLLHNKHRTPTTAVYQGIK